MKRALIRTLQALLPLAVLGVAVLAAVVLIRSRPPVATQPPRIEPPGVRVHEVSLDNVALAVVSQGTVRPRTESQLVSEIAGRVIWVAPSFAEGGFFETGDVLVRIDTFDYEQAIVSARSQLAQARLQLAQEEAEAEVAVREWDELGRGDPRELTLRKPQLEDARASVAAAEANLERAERDLERAQIVAPYAGRVRRKNVDVGQFVTVGGAVATIYAVDFAEVRLPLPDEELAFLDLPLSYRGATSQPTPGVTLRATFAGETHEWEGRIVRTESEIDPVSRMVHVVAEVEDPYAAGPNPNRPPLAVGMYVEAEIEGRVARDVAVVPRAALRGAGQVLVIGADDRISFRDIDVLRTTTEMMLVREGLAPGELVAVSPLDAATEGMLVQLADYDRAALAQQGGAQQGGAPPEPPAAAPAEAAAAAPARPEPPAPSPLAPVETAARAPRPEAAAADRAPAAPAAPASPLPSAPAASSPADGMVADAPERPAWLDALVAERPGSRRERPAPAGRPRDRARPASVPERSAAAASPAGRSLTEARSPATAAAPPPAAAATRPPTVATRPPAAATTRPPSVSATRPPAAVATRPPGAARIAPPAAAPERFAAGRPATPARLRTAPARPSLPEVPGIEGTRAGNSFSRAGGAPPTVAVAPFATLGTGPAGAGIGEALARAVAGSVAGTGMQAARSVEDARFAIDGGVQQVGPAIRVTARITDTGRADAVHAIKVDGSAEDLPALRRDVVSAIGAGLAELASAAPADVAAGVPPPVADFARDFARRRAATWRAPEPAPPPARALFEADRDLPPAGRRTPEPAPAAVPPAPSLSTSPVAVLTFDELGASGGDPGGVRLGRVITDTVTARLAGLPAVTIVTPGAEAVWTVGGGIQRVGDVVRVTARVVDIASGAVVTSVKVDGTVTELADLQNRVAAAVTRGVEDALAREMQVGAGVSRRNGRRS